MLNFVFSSKIFFMNCEFEKKKMFFTNARVEWRCECDGERMRKKNVDD